MNLARKLIEPREALFGLSGVSPFAPQQATFKGQHQAMQNLQRQQQMQQKYMQQQQVQQPQGRGALFGSNQAQQQSVPRGGFGSNASSQQANHALDYQMQLMLLEQQNQTRLAMDRQEQGVISGAGGHGGDVDDQTIIPELPTIGTQESEWTESVCDSLS